MSGKVRKVAGKAGETRKAVGVAVTGFSGVAYQVIDAGGLTKTTLKAAIAVVVATLACYGLTNEQPVAPGNPQGTER